MADLRLAIPALALALGLVGCDPDVINADGAADDTGPGASDGGGGDAGSGDGGSSGPTTETDCEDGSDNDSDGATDCDDSDCASFWSCDLPTSVSYHTLFDFDGKTIECELIGIGYDVDIDDCVTDASGRLNLFEGKEACPECDRTFRGRLDYAADSCSAMLDVEQPQDATLGFIFISPDERELWVPDDTWTWYAATTLTRTGDEWSSTTSEDIWVDDDDCDNGNQNIGTLTVSVEIADL